MCGSTDLAKPHCRKCEMVLCQFNAGLHLDAGKMQCPRPLFGELHEAMGQPLSSGFSSNGKLAKIEAVGFRGQEHARQCPLADDPDLSCLSLGCKRLRGKAMHGRGRVYAPIHVSKGRADQGQHVRQCWIVGSEPTWRQVHVTSPRKIYPAP
ncbi:hypothetical protein CLV76_10392 [Marivita geojedonensis]|nr:hypothetical protein CLV76_10392 [Marivita geojedonensis]